jgi:hypothetical protein
VDFVRAARAYCDWANGPPRDGLDDARAALRLLANLYQCALGLPVDPDLPQQRAPERDVTVDDLLPRLERFSRLPFQYYRCYFEPTDLEDEGVIGDLCDDLDSVWQDLRLGFLHWDAGDVIEAVWHWSFDFRSHWGRHACEALFQLHAWFEADFERWTQPPA